MKNILLTPKAIDYNTECMVQVIGRKNSKETRKAIMLLKEHRLAFSFVDLDSRDLSKREWESILRASSPEVLIDKSSSAYKKGGYEWKEYNPLEELILNPELLLLPIIRDGSNVIIGFEPKLIKERFKCICVCHMHKRGINDKLQGITDTL